MTSYQPSKDSPSNLPKLSEKLRNRRKCLTARERSYLDMNRSALVQRVSLRAAERRASQEGDQRIGANLARFGDVSGLEVLHSLGSLLKKLEENDRDQYEQLRRWFKQT